MDLNLLEKTELWIENIELKNANLNRIAEVIAKTINIPGKQVLVVDVRDNHITLDILKKNIQAEDIFGKKNAILKAIKKIPGIKVFKNTDIHSDGILGMISLEESMVDEVIANTQNMNNEIIERIKKRVIVFPTGFEVKRKMIVDTNTPYIIEELLENGYTAQAGNVIDDDLELLTGVLGNAVNDGFGLIITTGGVGAEDKDKTVEAIERLDGSAATPYIVKFKKGTGRHKKDGVRIGVGKVGQTLIVALPGPNDEVRIAIKVLLAALENNSRKKEIARDLAAVLQKKLITKPGVRNTLLHSH